MKLEWTEGNRIALLENGEAFYPRAFEAIAGARREVLLETFILFDDKVGRALQQALLAAARGGAEVHVLVDGWGSPDLPADFVGPLVEAGVRLRSFEPARWLLGARLNMFRRMHRKLLVVDDRVAFVGGINYSVDHLGEYGPMAKQDYAVEIEGPLVQQIRAFCRASLETPQPPRHHWLARWRKARRRAQTAPEPGGAQAALVTRDNHAHRRDIELQYRMALRTARERVVIANAYFFPGYFLLKDLRRAARRGVRVDLILQGQPDMPVVRVAASMLYAHLVRAGVRVHEYCRRPLHGKVAVADDTWATVGSSNLDPLSLGLNLEANVVIRDAGFARELRERLDTLIAQSCREVQVAPASGFASAWTRLRTGLVFHLLRRFPRWLMALPAQAPHVAPLEAGAAAVAPAPRAPLRPPQF